MNTCIDNIDCAMLAVKESIKRVENSFGYILNGVGLKVKLEFDKLKEDIDFLEQQIEKLEG